MMKNTLTKKILSLILLLSTLFSLFGCQSSSQKQSDKEVLKGQDLTVLHTPVSYGPLDTAYLTTELGSIYFRTTALLNKTTPSEEQQSSVKQYIKENVLPMLASVGVTKDEMRQLIYYTQFLLKTAENSSILIAKKLLEETYHSYIQVLGSKRAGMLLYRGCILYLEHQLKTESENTEEISLQLEQLRDVLGEDAFTEAATVFYFSYCLFTKNESSKENSQFPPLTDQELLLLWQRQADHLLSLSLSDLQWQTAADFFCRLLFKLEKSPFEKNSLKSALWQTLQYTDGDSIGIGKVIPSFVSLYSQLVSKMTVEHIKTLRTGSDDERWLCLTALAGQCPEELLTFLTSFSENVRIESEATEKVLKDKGLWQNYLSYCQAQTTLTSKQLCEMLGSEDLSKDLLISAIEGYLFATLPHTAFAFFYERSLTT